jgi:hypothetical protein
MLFQVWPAKSSIFHSGECIHFCLDVVVDHSPSLKTGGAAPGPYEIRHLVPASDRDPGDPCYRIKSITEKHERVARESDLTLSVSVFA